MLGASGAIHSKSLLNLIKLVKCMLIVLNVILFYITFHFSTYIYLSWDNYVIYGLRFKWIGESYSSFVAVCWISAAVFLIVSWKSMAGRTGLLQVVVLAATPTLFYLVFGELAHLML